MYKEGDLVPTGPPTAAPMPEQTAANAQEFWSHKDGEDRENWGKSEEQKVKNQRELYFDDLASSPPTEQAPVAISQPADERIPLQAPPQSVPVPAQPYNQSPPTGSPEANGVITSDKNAKTNIKSGSEQAEDFLTLARRLTPQYFKGK